MLTCQAASQSCYTHSRPRAQRSKLQAHRRLFIFSYRHVPAQTPCKPSGQSRHPALASDGGFPLLSTLQEYITKVIIFLC